MKIVTAERRATAFRPGRVISTLSALALLAFSAFAQSTNARLDGTVQDPTGAVIPNAKIEVVSDNTQARAEVTTDTSGAFVFPNLAPGLYTVTGEANGFRKTVVKKVELSVSGTVSLIVKLEVGQTSESINVEASSISVQTTDSQVSSAVLMRDIEVLPQLGRSPIALAIFQPGVQIDVRAGQDSSFSHVNGLRQGSNNAKLDGVDVNDSLVPRIGLSLTQNNSDSVGEFRVVTEGGKAEYGRSAGGQVELITKSGTNTFHGNAYDFLRNTVLNANDFFNNQSGGTVPKLIQNTFGASFGGPVMKNKFFIFGNYQGGRTQQEVIRNRTVYTESAKAGIFKWKDSAGVVRSYDFGAADPRKIGPDPTVAKINSSVPVANNFDLGDGLNTAGYRFNNPVTAINDQFTIRGDYHINSKNVAFMRWSWYKTDSTDNLNNADATFPGQPQGSQGGTRWGYAIGDNWTLTPSLINEFTIGHQSASVAFNRPARPAGPCISTNLVTDIINCGFTQGRNSPVNDITDNVTMVHGNHTFKAGANIRMTNQYGYNYAGSGGAGVYPNITFGTGNGNSVPTTVGPAGITTSQRSTFDSLYNDILGRVDRVLQTYFSDLTTYLPAGQPKVRNYILHEGGYFFQDDWRVTRRLTLNLGLRWEYFGVPFERDGLQGSIDQAAQVGAGYTSSNLTVVPKGPLFKTDWNNFAPRLGFSFDPAGDGKTAIRGNWGMFYDRTVGAAINSIDGATPGFSANSQTFPNQAAGSDFRYSEKYPTPPQPAAPLLTLPTTRSTTLYLADPNLKTGYVSSWGLNIQREVARNLVLQAGYIGNSGIKLFMDVDVNQPRVSSAFQADFRELAANLNTPANVSANNLFVKLYGTAASAISTVGSTNLSQGRVGTVINTIDVTGNAANNSRYAAAGVSNYYFRNYPQFTQVVQGTNNGRSYYHSMQLSLRRTAGAVQFAANYTWSKSMDNISAEGNGFTTPIDSYNLRLNRARSDFDRPHSLNISAFYTVPFGKGQQWGGNMPRLLDTLIGGWQVGALQIAQSGQPFSVSSQRATTPVSGTTPGNTYANYAGTDRNIGVVTPRGDGVYYFTPDQVAQFTYPDAFQIGNSGRNVFRNPGFFETDASLVKKFRITENHAVQFRAEAYNLFNHTNFGFAAANLNINTPASFGKFSQTLGTQTSSGSSRTMQLALRYDF
ncbi:MAG TPA: TonB-dependent receptor [Bryobacteraceae bacterium]|nr:TonB-dependent receptor [Bryobacteraceae bacterium]